MASISSQLRLQDTRAHTVRNVAIGKSILKISDTKSVSNLILAAEVRCHKVQGMTKAFFDSIIPGKFICCLAQEKR